MTDGLYEKLDTLEYVCELIRAERDKLAAENARLREAIAFALAEWRRGQEQIAALEAELAALRQIVADVETCANCALLFSLVTIHGLGPDERYASRLGSVLFYGPTWQAALHAAAEWVRAGGER